VATFLGLGAASKARALIEDAFAKIAKGSGATQQVGLRCTGVGLTGYVRGDARDERKLENGLLGLTKRLLREPRARSYLRARKLILSAKRSRIERVQGHVWRLRLAPIPGERDREAIDLLFNVGSQRYHMAAGMQPTATMKQLLAADPEASYPTTRFPVKIGLPPSPWLLAHFDADRFAACLDGSPEGSGSQSVGLAVGQQGEALALRLRVDASLITRLLSHLM
jgi:hypothetical protein